jgi:hypothetical protein
MMIHYQWVLSGHILSMFGVTPIIQPKHVYSGRQLEHSVRILYIEDTPAYIEIIERLATHLKHELLVAKTGADALKLLVPQLGKDSG